MIGNPLDQVVGVLAAMMGRRAMVFADALDQEGSGQCVPTHFLQGDAVVEGRSTPHEWTQSLDGFALVLSTSGTTGRPKLVVHDESSLAAGLALTASVEDELHGDSGIELDGSCSALGHLIEREPHGLRFLSALPITAISGVSMMFRAIAMGESFSLPGSLDPQAVWEDVLDLGVTNIGMPPITAMRFASFASDSTRERPRLLHIGIGGSFVDPDLAVRLEEHLGCLVTIGYGSTELGGVAVMSRPWDSQEIRSSTIGRPLRGIDVRLDAVESGAELIVKSPALARGILEDDGMRQLMPWYATGDLATWSPNGGLIIAGRTDFVISRGSRRIDPAQIEAIIERHPVVDRAGVVGVPSRVVGNQDIVAFVVRSSNSRDVASRDLSSILREYCVEQLMNFEVPRTIEVVDHLPLLADRGLDRVGLRMLGEAVCELEVSSSELQYNN